MIWREPPLNNNGNNNKATSLGKTSMNISHHVFNTDNDTAMQPTHVSHNFSPTATVNTSRHEDCIMVRFTEMEYLPWDNPDNIVSEHVEKVVLRIRNYVLAFCALIGIPANVINMAVFFKQSLKDRVNLCLFSLSLADGIFLVISTLDNSEIIFASKNYGPIHTFLANTNLIAIYGALCVSLVISTIIACERCFCVLNPLKYQTLLRTKTMAVIIAAVYFVTLGLSYIMAFRYHIGCIYDPTVGTVLTTVVLNAFYAKHQQFIDILDSVVFGAGLMGTTMTVIVVTTIITSFKLRQVVTWRAETSSSLSAREVALTKMLIGASVLFIVCSFPGCLFRVVCLFFPQMTAGGRNQNFYFFCLWLTDELYFVNSSFNIFLYYKMGSRYRDTLWTLFCRNRRGRKSVRCNK